MTIRKFGAGDGEPEPYEQTVRVPDRAFVIEDDDALRVTMAHILLKQAAYGSQAEIRRDIISWAIWLGKPEIIPPAWYRNAVYKYNLHIPPEVAERQVAIYDAMIRRAATGSDPLVQEPGP